MAPELFEDDPKSLPNFNYMLCDLYSFGVVLFEMITGKKPWAKLEPLEIMRNVTERNQRPLDALKGYQLPESHSVLAGLMTRCWYKDAQRRPRSFEEVERELGPDEGLPLPRVMAVAPMETPEGYEYTDKLQGTLVKEEYEALHYVVEEAHRIGGCYNNSEVVSSWEEVTTLRLDMAPPKVMIFCCHREKHRVLVGRQRDLLMNEGLVQLFQDRIGQAPNPECIVFSTCAMGSTLHRDLVERAGIDFVIYWRGKALDRVAARYTGLFLEKLKDSVSLASPFCYRRAYKAAKQTLEDELVAAFEGSSGSDKEALLQELNSLERLTSFPSSSRSRQGVMSSVPHPTRSVASLPPNSSISRKKNDAA